MELYSRIMDLYDSISNADIIKILNKTKEELQGDTLEQKRLRYSVYNSISPKEILYIGDIDHFDRNTNCQTANCKIYNGNDSNFEIIAQKFDLVHISDIYDGDELFDYLELGLKTGSWIYLEGVFNSPDTMSSSMHLLGKYRTLLNESIIFPHHSGSLLINVKLNLYSNKFEKYSDLQNYYSEQYFMGDCGGYEEFKKYKGQMISTRLESVLRLVNPKKDEIILDIGCGRGELAYALSKQSRKVVGVDYSKDAIDIAMRTYLPNEYANYEFVCEDIMSMDFPEKFDKIVMSDVVEHIEDEVLDVLFKKVSDLLKSDGRVIIHTAPNKLVYEKEYVRNRTMVKNHGGYLPENPRSFYEDLMHINEQTPDSLKLLLNKVFSNSIVWPANVEDIYEPLTKDMSNEESSKYHSIFGIASKQIINKEIILEALVSHRYSDSEVALCLATEVKRLSAKRGENIIIPLRITNKGVKMISSLKPFPTNISYHIYDGFGEVLTFDGVRTRLHTAINPKQTEKFDVRIVAPTQSGKYTVRLTLVQEQMFWLDGISEEFYTDIELDVK